jgi:hypothetical protein
MCNQCKENERKLQIIKILEIFQSPRGGHNSVKNGSIVAKTDFDLDILMINLHTKFHFNMCNQCEENERKLMVDRPTDSSKAICPPFFEGGHKYKSKLHNSYKHWVQHSIPCNVHIYVLWSFFVSLVSLKLLSQFWRSKLQRQNIFLTKGCNSLTHPIQKAQAPF